MILVQVLRTHPTCRLVKVGVLRAVRGYNNLGTMTTATLRFDPEVAARTTSASCAEAALSREICGQTKLRRQVRVNIAGALQASLLYAAAMWVSLPVPQKKKLVVRYYGPHA